MDNEKDLREQAVLGVFEKWAEFLDNYGKHVKEVSKETDNENVKEEGLLDE